MSHFEHHHHLLIGEKEGTYTRYTRQEHPKDKSWLSSSLQATGDHLLSVSCCGAWGDNRDNEESGVG